jgi:hypothetical protein
MNEWIAPGTSTAAVIFVVIIFLRQMRYMQTKHDKAMTARDEAFGTTIKNVQAQLDRMENQRNANEERRMNQIQGIFDKFLVITTQMVQGMAKLEQGFAVITAKLEGKRVIDDKKIEDTKGE